MMSNLKWSRSNRKVSKLDAVSFGIPAYRSQSGFKTCPKAGACAAVCYARQGFYTMTNVQQSREFNLSLARGDLKDFVHQAVEDLTKFPERLIRVHDSGDFFSQAYLNAWGEIARACPDKLFYAYTKSLHLNFDNLPENFRITQSEGGKLDHKIDRKKPHARIFATHARRKAAGYGDGTNTDTMAIQGKTKIGLVYHGQKHLTEAQEEYFS